MSSKARRNTSPAARTATCSTRPLKPSATVASAVSGNTCSTIRAPGSNGRQTNRTRIRREPRFACLRPKARAAWAGPVGGVQHGERVQVQGLSQRDEVQAGDRRRDRLAIRAIRPGIFRRLPRLPEILQRLLFRPHDFSRSARAGHRDLRFHPLSLRHRHRPRIQRSQALSGVARRVGPGAVRLRLSGQRLAGAAIPSSRSTRASPRAGSSSSTTR